MNTQWQTTLKEINNFEVVMGERELAFIRETHPAMRLFCVAVLAYALYRLGLIFSAISIYGFSAFLLGQLVMYGLLVLVFAYIPRREVMTVSPEGIKREFGYRLHRFFVLKKQFLPVGNCRSLLISSSYAGLPGRRRKFYVVSMFHQLDTGFLDVEGVQTLKMAQAVVDAIKFYLKMPNLGITVRSL